MEKRFTEKSNQFFSPAEHSKETTFFLRCILVFTVLLLMTGCGDPQSADQTVSDSTENTTESTTKAESTSESGSEAAVTDIRKKEDVEAYNRWISDVPETFQDTWTSHGLTYEWDASVIVPEIESFPLYQKSATDFSQEAVDRVVSYFTKNRYPVSLKDYISYTAYRADLEDLCTVSDGIARIWDYRFQYGQYSYMDTDLASLQYTHDNSADKLMDYQSDYLSTNGARLPKWNSEDAVIHTLYENYSDFGLIKDVEGIVMAFPNDMGLYDLLAITDQAGEHNNNQRYIQYLSYDQSKVQLGLLEEECELTRNQAIQKAEELVAEFGIDNLIPGQVQYLAGYYTVYFKSTAEPLDYPENLSNYLPMPLAMDDDGYTAEQELYLMGYQDAYITLSQDHIREICLPFPSYDSVHVTDISYADILTFSEMMEGYRYNFERIAEYMEDTGMLSNSESHIVINEIRLLNMYVFTGWNADSEKTTAVYENMPTWCFFGQIDTGLDLSEEIMWSQHLDISDGNCLIGTVRAPRNPEDSRFAGETRDIPFHTSDYSQDIIILGRNNYLVEDDGLAHIIGN